MGWNSLSHVLGSNLVYSVDTAGTRSIVTRVQPSSGPAPALESCAVIGRSPTLSVLWFPHLKASKCSYLPVSFRTQTVGAGRALSRCLSCGENPLPAGYFCHHLRLQSVLLEGAGCRGMSNGAWTVCEVPGGGAAWEEWWLRGERQWGEWKGAGYGEGGRQQQGGELS